MKFFPKNIAMLAFLSALSTGLCCQGQELIIPTPEGMSKESVKRIEQQYKKQIEAFGQLLLELDQNRFRQSEESLRLPIPASADNESIQRIKSNFGEQFSQFSELLFELDRNRLKPGEDTLSSTTRKQAAVSRQLTKWYSGIYGKIQSNSNTAMNYIYFCNDVCPRLSGRVINVGPNSKYTSVSEALSKANNGDRLQLESGDIEFGSELNSKITDIEIRGDKAGTTIKLNRTSRMPNDKLTRFRFMNVAFDCDNNEFSVGHGSSAEFRNCEFSNYNSGAGGSNALSGRDCVLLIENCLFDGKDGRGAGRRTGGNAFDVRGNDLFYLRNTKFIDNGNIRLRRAVIDRCAVTSTDPDLARYQYLQGTVVKMRESDLGRNSNQNRSQFSYDVDDLEFVQAVKKRIEGDVEIPDQIASVVENLQLTNNIQYWIGLLRIGNPDIQKLAAQRVMKLTGLNVNLPEPIKVTEDMKQKIDQLIAQLDDNKASQRESATEQLKATGKAASEQLQQILSSGSPEQKARSRKILESFVEVRNIEIEKEVGRLLNWFDENKDKLEFNEETGVFESVE